MTIEEYKQVRDEIRQSMKKADLSDNERESLNKDLNDAYFTLSSSDRSRFASLGGHRS
jgi:hypothetical protein